MLKRKEIYELLNEYGLKEAVKEKWLSDYTRVSSEKLMVIITDYQKRKGIAPKPKKELDKVTPDDISDKGLRKSFIKLLSTLQASNTLFPDEVEDILNEL